MTGPWAGPRSDQDARALAASDPDRLLVLIRDEEAGLGLRLSAMDALAYLEDTDLAESEAMRLFETENAMFQATAIGVLDSIGTTSAFDFLRGIPLREGVDERVLTITYEILEDWDDCHDEEQDGA
jgi:hypothetical protein